MARMNHLTSTPEPGPHAVQQAVHLGHVLQAVRGFTEPDYAKCLECGLKFTVDLDVERVIEMGPCPATEEGRRLIALAEAEEAQPATITEPCVAVPPEWEGTEAEAVGLAVAGAVADLVRQRDDMEDDLTRARSLLMAVVDVFPQTSFAGANVPLEEARTYLAQTTPAPSPDQ
jgi:hypothetical protein